jgi:hypothetical protein
MWFCRGRDGWKKTRRRWLYTGVTRAARNWRWSLMKISLTYLATVLLTEPMAKKKFSDGTTTIRIEIATRDAAKARAKSKGQTLQGYLSCLILRDIGRPSRLTRNLKEPM